MKFTFVREIIGGPVPIKLGADIMGKAGKVIRASILDNIKQQRQADGSPLKSNSPRTIERKIRLGQRPLSLVDQGHRLVKGGDNGSYSVDAGPGIVTVRPSDQIMQAPIKQVPPMHGRKRRKRTQVTTRASPREITRWVQEAGYLGYFKPGASGIAALKALFAQHIREQIAKASKARKRTEKK